jgi:opacity protein-like surface antigen
LTQPPDLTAWRRLFGAAALLVLATGVAHPLPAQNQALVLSVHGGRHNPLVDLTDAGDDLAAGFSYGGGIALQLNPNVALRGMVTRHRTRYRGSAATLADSAASQFVAAGDVQIGWPGTSALVPYIYVGGGGVITDWDDPVQDSSSRFAGRFGVGLNRVSGLGAFFLEIGGLIYEFKSIGLKHVQFDVETRLGFALALGL